MVRKGKTSARTPSKLSDSDASPIVSCSQQFNPSVDDIAQFILEKASTKYPGFITKSAFCGRIADVESESKCHEARIWLSESSMVASSILPGSLVSVSLAALRDDNVPGRSLPSSLLDDYTDEFKINSENGTFDQVGSCFALAIVFPSCKVLKNGVKLSWSLSSSMGCPVAGRVVFISPISNGSVQFSTSDLSNLDNSFKARDSSLSLHWCEELYLKLIHVKNDVIRCHPLPKMGHSSSKSEHISTPKAPINQLNCTRDEGFVESLHISDRTSVSSIHIALEDEKIKELLEIYAIRWLSTRILLHGNLVTFPLCGQLCVFQVEGVNKRVLESPHTMIAFVVDLKTKIHLLSSTHLTIDSPVKRNLLPVECKGKDPEFKEMVTASRLGGLSKESAILTEIISFSLMKKTLSRLNLQSVKGVLLYGPPGTGKTSLARSCVREAGVRLFSINGAEIVSQYYGESEMALQNVFDTAQKNSPSVVFIDELDAIAPSRIGGEQLSHRMVAALLNLMDGISRNDGILVVAATNRPDSIDSALRRPGRFDQEIEIGVPSPDQRFDILCTRLSDMHHSLTNSEIQSIASTTHGFVGADIAALCNEAAFTTLRRYIQFMEKEKHVMQHYEHGNFKLENGGSYSCKGQDVSLADNVESVSTFLSDLNLITESDTSFSCVENSSHVKNNSKDGFSHSISKGFCFRDNQAETVLTLTYDDFQKAKMKVRPSAMREVMIEIPKVNWEDVGGQKEVKRQLLEVVEWPQVHQNDLKRIGCFPPSGVLMFGPPGCSKTLMARAIASRAGLNFIAVKGPELLSKWVGESEKAVKAVFVKARTNAPSIVFFDEIDGLAIRRGKGTDGTSVADRVMGQLLTEFDGLNQRIGVTVIAATNRPDKIDPALLRPGRFDRLLYVGLPNESDREEIFCIHLRKIPCAPDVNLKELSQLTEGYTGADISAICRESALTALEENIDTCEVSMRHFMSSINSVQPSDVGSYLEFSTRFQRLVFSSKA